MSSLSIRLTYRPVQLGWCVERGDWEGLRRAMRNAFTVWGGRFHPIIIIDDEVQANRLVDLFRVDTFYPASEGAKSNAFIARQKHLAWFDHKQELVLDYDVSGKFPALADLNEPMIRLYDDYFRNNAQAEPVLTLFEWTDEDPLADIFLSTFGALPPASETASDYRSFMTVYLRATRAVISADSPVPLLPPGTMSLAMLNKSGLNRYYPDRGQWRRPGFYVGHAANFDDIVHYWNLRATDANLLFVDPDHIERLATFRPLLANAIASNDPTALITPAALKGISLWHRPETNIDKVTGWGEEIRDCIVSEASWNGLNLAAPTTSFGEAETLASVDNSREPPLISFALPDRPIKTDSFVDSHRFVVSVSPGSRLAEKERFTLNLPYLPQLNDYYSRVATHSWNDARAEPGALGFITAGSRSHMSMQAVEVPELIGAIFQSAGIAASPSPAGLVCNRLVTQMGGVDSCRVFRIGGVRELIERFSPDQSFTRSTAKQIIRGKDSAHPIENYDSLYIEPRKIGSKLRNDDVLAHLLRKEIFRPGLKLDCPSCQLDFWRSLDELRTRNDCEYCGHSFNVGPQLKDRDWAFRRSGLFGRSDNQQGSIPVVLTLQQLLRMSSLGTPFYSTAMTLRSDGADIPDCETDFVFVAPRDWSRKVQLAIGECKTRQQISAQDVDNLLRVAKSFPEKWFDVFIVFSKLADFSDEELGEIARVNEGHRKRAILLTTRELEPWHIYQRTEKLFDIPKAAISLANLAEITTSVFYDKMSKAGHDKTP